MTPCRTCRKKKAAEFALFRHLAVVLGILLVTAACAKTVALETPATPKITQALRLLLNELNTTPPRIPGDHRPITYKIKTG